MKARAILSAVICVLIGLGLFGWAGYTYVKSTTGETASAVVERCDVKRGRKGRSSTTCYGTWTANGQKVTGEINGAGSDDEGKTLDVRVDGNTAYTFSGAAIAVPAVIGGFMLLAGLVWAIVGARSGRKNPPPVGPRGPVPGYGPQPGYPPQPGYAPYPPQPVAQRGYPPAQYPPAQVPPAQYPPAQYPPGQYQPPAQYAPNGQNPPVQYPPNGPYRPR